MALLCSSRFPAKVQAATTLNDLHGARLGKTATHKPPA